MAFDTLATCRITTMKEGENPWLSVTLIEGKNNQIRKMFERIGHYVVKLKRVQIGFLKDRQLKPGEFRHLTTEEIHKFKKLSAVARKR
jgi:23S rRNA pseudouridine2605 synthase